MKGLIDLYKVINDALIMRGKERCIAQCDKSNGKFFVSDAIGLTKEQRTRLASQETRSDANKAFYY